MRQNFDTGLRWMRKAAEQGLRELEFNPGIIYSTGRGGEKNNLEAERWFSKAAAQGLVADGEGKKSDFPV